MNKLFKWIQDHPAVEVAIECPTYMYNMFTITLTHNIYRTRRVIPIEDFIKDIDEYTMLILDKMYKELLESVYRDS